MATKKKASKRSTSRGPRAGAPYPRDLVGYGRNPPNPRWPNNARVAVQFVLNYEEGGENNVLHGDQGSEQFLSEIIGAASYPARHLSMESIYEYGSRVGVWRILREFERRKLPLTVFGISMALERHPEVTAAFDELGHEIACHGWRWLHYQNAAPKLEAEHMRIGTEIIRRMTGGKWPLGWYTGRDSPNTRRLLVEHGGYEYDSDYYGDELPFWTDVATKKRVEKALVVPYTLDTNDMRFATPQGFNTGEQFLAYLKDSFNVLYAEGAEQPKMMSIGLHCRLVGRPGRFAALQHFLDYVQKHERVWICRRIDIARHWREKFPSA